MKLFVNALLFLCTVSCARLGGSRLPAPLKFLQDKLIELRDRKELKKILKDKTPRTFASKDNQGYEIITDDRCLKDEGLKGKLKNGPVEFTDNDFNDGRKLLKGAKFISKQYYEAHIDEWKMVSQCLKKDDGYRLYEKDDNAWTYKDAKTKKEKHPGKPHFKDVEGNGAELTFDTPETKSEGDEQGAKQSTAGSGEQPGLANSQVTARRSQFIKKLVPGEDPHRLQPDLAKRPTEDYMRWTYRPRVLKRTSSTKGLEPQLGQESRRASVQ